MSRSTVRNFVYAGAFPERANTLRAKSLLDPYIPYLEKRWEQGCRNANQLWKELQERTSRGADQSAEIRETVHVWPRQFSTLASTRVEGFLMELRMSTTSAEESDFWDHYTMD